MEPDSHRKLEIPCKLDNRSSLKKRWNWRIGRPAEEPELWKVCSRERILREYELGLAESDSHSALDLWKR